MRGFRTLIRPAGAGRRELLLGAASALLVPAAARAQQGRAQHTQPAGGLEGQAEGPGHAQGERHGKHQTSKVNGSV